MLKTHTAPYAALLLRVSMGLLFLAHAAAKVFIFTLPGFVAYFASLGLPAPVAYAILALETLGGIALLLGIYAPLVAIPLCLELLGTIFFVHGANGWLVSNKGGGWEFAALWAASLAALFLIGDGPYALRPVHSLKR